MFSLSPQTSTAARRRNRGGPLRIHGPPQPQTPTRRSHTSLPLPLHKTHTGDQEGVAQECQVAVPQEGEQAQGPCSVLCVFVCLFLYVDGVCVCGVGGWMDGWGGRVCSHLCAHPTQPNPQAPNRRRRPPPPRRPRPPSPRHVVGHFYVYACVLCPGKVGSCLCCTSTPNHTHTHNATHTHNHRRPRPRRAPRAPPSPRRRRRKEATRCVFGCLRVSLCACLPASAIVPPQHPRLILTTPTRHHHTHAPPQAAVTPSLHFLRLHHPGRLRPSVS